MDGYRLDAIARALATVSTRRRLLSMALGLPALVVTRRASATEEPPCDPPLTACGGICTNLLWDEANCGDCGHACGFGQACDAGTCTHTTIFCIVPDVPCNSVCVNLQTDDLNCGMCGNECASGTSCVDGVCWGEAIACEAPLVMCGGDCVDLNSSFGNCGACGNACPGVQDATCCFGVCARLFSDPYNCGGCGNVCPDNAVCVQSSGADGPPNGICVCLDGFAACGEGCFDLSSDFYSCGACFNACASGQSCVNGVCTSTTTEPTPAQSPEPTATATATETAGGDKWRWWTTHRPRHGAVIYQRRRLSDDDPIAMGDGPAGPSYTGSDFARLAALGATYAVLSIPLPVEVGDPGSLDQDQIDQIDDLIGHASDAGLAVVIAPRTGPGRTEASLAAHLVCAAGGCLLAPTATSPEEATIWTDAGARDDWAAGWTRLARRYAGREEVVGYELLSLADPPSRSAWKRLTDQLVQAIRDVDEETPILLNAPGMPDHGLANRLTRDPFTVHTIDWFAPARLLTQEVDAAGALTYPGRFDGEQDGSSGHFDRAWIEEQTAPITEFMDRYDKPVAVGGFGLPRWQPGAADYLSDLLTVFDDLKLNSALWLWYPAVWPGEADGWDITRGPDRDNHDTVDNELLDVVREHWR